MAHWNYRIFKEIEYTGVIDESNGTKEIEEEIYTIREVHYNDDGTPKSYTENPSYPSGNTPTELKQDVINMKAAFNKAMLSVDDFI